MAALLETVDLEFERVLQQRQAYTEVIDTSDEESELNVDLLRQILDARLPAANRDEEGDDYGGLFKDLTEAGVKTVRSLNQLIASNLEQALLDDQKLVSAFRHSGKAQRDGRIQVESEFGPYRGRPERIERGVFWTHAGLIRHMLSQK